VVVAHPAYAPVPWSATGQPNVWGVLPATGAGGRSLVLNGHIDVVPPGPGDQWQYGPWSGTVDGNRLYGRGSMDMKSGLVAGMLAMRALATTGVERRGPVIFECVIEEECSGNGMLAQRLQTGPVDGAIILEPTADTTWIITPGVVWFEITVSGKAAYVGQGTDLVNAIEVAADLIGKMKPRMVQELNAAFSHPGFAHLENPLALNVGAIEGGGWPSAVPLECRFTCRMSYPIDWSFKDVRRFVEHHLDQATAGDAWFAKHPPRLRFSGFRAAGWEYRADPALLDLIGAAHRLETGRELTRLGWPGTADGRYFPPETPVAYYGPAGGGIHGPDEYVELDSLRHVTRALVNIIAEWCA
jgi:acetylornithine deacetylase